jgi:eukaryotic-like serine/threonine-protein kinase
MSEDETRQGDVSGDATSADATKGDATSGKGPTPGDATRPQPATGKQPPAGGANDATAVVPRATGPSGTGILPAVGGEAPKWSARAQVRPSSVDDDVPADWEDVGAEPRRGLVGPILISVGAVVVLALIVAAVLLLMRNSAEPVTPPTATATASVASPTPSPTAEATTPPPTSNLQTSFGPEPVEIPRVAGSSFDAAATVLRGLGLQVRRVDQSSATVPAGQVIDTEPPAGTLALPGLPVDVIVSTGPAQAPSTTTTSPPN